MALEPNIILQAGNFRTPDYAETMERRTAIQLRNAEVARQGRADQLAQAKAVRLGAIGAKAAAGDLAGARTEATAAGDFDVLDHINKLEDAQRATIQRRVDAAAPLAFEASKLPYDQRKAFIAGQAQRLVANGWSPEELANFDPTDQALGSIVASSQTIKDMLDRQDKAADRTLRREEAAATRDFQRGNAYISAGLLPPGSPGVGAGGGAGAAPGGGNVSRLINTDAGGGYVPDTVQTLGQFVDFGRGLNQRGAKSSSAGAYQINGSTMREFGPKVFGNDWASQPYTHETQDAVGRAIFDWAKSQRNPVAALRGRWVGLDADTARKLVAGSWEGARGVIAQTETGGAPGASASAGTAGGLQVIPGGKLDRPKAAKMTPDEVKAEGLDPNVVYYRNADGVPQAVSGQDKKTAGGNLKPPPVAATKAYIDNRTSIRKLREAWTAIDRYPDAVGFTKGILPNAVTSRTDPKGVDARAKVADIGSLKIHDRSGAAVTAAETPRLLPFIPGVGDTPEAVKTKLHNFRLELERMNEDIADAYSEEQGYKFPKFNGTLTARQPAARAAPAAPKVGTVQGGYRFKGGNPAAQSSWEKVK